MSGWEIYLLGVALAAPLTFLVTRKNNGEVDSYYGFLVFFSACSWVTVALVAYLGIGYSVNKFIRARRRL